MLNSKNPVDFDRGDDLADLLGSTSPAPRAMPADEQLARVRETAEKAQAEGHWDTCTKCGGSGQTRWGQCFRCKGKGGKMFKTSFVERKQARESADARQARAAAANWDAWAAENEGRAAWILANAATFPFAADMLAKVKKYGNLFDGALAAIDRCVARHAERQEARKVERAAQEARVVDLTVTKIGEAFANARAQGLKRLTLRYDGIKIKQKRDGSDVLFVTDHGQYGESKYYGKIVAGRFLPARECTDEIRDRLIAIAQDPAAAAKVYGKETGTCCCCGAELTDPVSIANGIGPICAGNYGF